MLKKHPCTKSSISSKLRNVFAWKFQGLLRRKCATSRTSFVQYNGSVRKWHNFWFLMCKFQVNALQTSAASTISDGMQAGLFHGRKDVLHQPTGQHWERQSLVCWQKTWCLSKSAIDRESQVCTASYGLCRCVFARQGMLARCGRKLLRLMQITT